MSMLALTLKQAAACLAFNLSQDIPTFIWGPPGVGKSQLVHQVTDKLDYEMYDIRLSLRDPVDLRGLPLVDPIKGTTRWLPPAELPDSNTKKKILLFLDECNATNIAMQRAAMQLVLERKLGEYRLPVNCKVVAAGNRMVDKAAAERLNSALKNRFAHLEVVADTDSWVDWAARKGLHAITIGFIKFRPGLLHKMPVGDENAFPTPRAWEQVNKLVNAPDSIRLQLVMALVGEGAAMEFEGFIQTFRHLPSIDAIMTNPKTAAVPDANAVASVWAVSQALAMRCTNEKEFGNAITYCKRLPKEFEVSMVTDAVKRDPKLQKTKAYVAWCVDNQEVVV